MRNEEGTMNNEKRKVKNEKCKRGYLGVIFPFFFLHFSLFFCFSCGFGGSIESLRPEAGGHEPATFVAVTGITDVPTVATAGTPLILTSMVAPHNATNKTITWSVYSAGATGASINGNTLNTTAAGTVTMRATISNGTAAGNYTQNFIITVNADFVAVTGITGVPEMAMAGTLTLTGTVAPYNATNQTIVWNVVSAGTTGASINGNTLNTTAAGSVTIKATIANGTAQGTNYTQNFSITVTVTTGFVAVTGISGVPETATAGTILTLTGTVAPYNATNQTIVWSIVNAGTTGATISGNWLYATAVGTVTVRATIADGLGTGTPYTEDFTVTVGPAFVAVTGITGVPETIIAGTPLLLTGTVAPDNATYQTIVWSVQSEGTTGATISNGNTLNTTVAGTVTVRATITNGTAQGTDYTKDFNIMVNAPFLEMIWISAGTFQMGSPSTELNRNQNETQHQVTLTQGFYMGKYEVTQAQYQVVMGTNPSSHKTPVPPETSTVNHPVEMVSWYYALVFCNKLSMNEGLSPAYRISGSTDPAVWGTVPTEWNTTWNAAQIVEGSTGYRLPTEAQWEYACRAGTTTAYNTGDTISDNTGWCFGSNGSSGNMTHEVGLKPANAWGLYDMHGNVMEWCWDWYGTYASGAQTDPVGASSGSCRIKRGGSWLIDGQYMRSAYRHILSNPNAWDSSSGFRLIRP
jgi:formylglycine-generating enzyme required for sulfatase activity